MTELQGIAVSPGVGIGPVFLYRTNPVSVQKTFIAPGREASEQAHFEAGLAKAVLQLNALAKNESLGQEADIFSAQCAILQDEDFLQLVAEGISARREAAEWAVYAAYAQFIALMEEASNPLVASRAADLRDVRDRLIRILSGIEQPNLANLPGPCILVAKDLLPSDTATLDRENVLGIITEGGGPASHTAIIAGSYRIPTVVGVAGCTTALPQGATVGLNALTGQVFLHPNPHAIAGLKRQMRQHLARRAQADTYLAKPTLMADGTRYEIGVNIGGTPKPDTFEHCDFVGLFRTEFLYMENDHLPTEEEQYVAYRRVVYAAGGRPVTLRTLDIGGDKTLSYLQLPREGNPFLGLRALRLCLARPALFQAQLRAALRAAAHGPLSIMLPMAGSLEDIRAGKAALQQAQSSLKAEGVPFGQVRLGVMVEIPSLAAVADLAAAEVDFGSIGTNDLCQYLCAADRMSPGMEMYYQTFSPAMVRTLAGVTDAFAKAGKPLSVCGEMAGDPAGALLLCGLGLRRLSMDASRIAPVKAALSKVSAPELSALAKQALTLQTQAQVQALFNQLL